MIIYRVYEIAPKCRKHGRAIKDFKTLKGALNCVNKSIYRYYLEIPIIDYSIKENKDV